MPNSTNLFKAAAKAKLLAYVNDDGAGETLANTEILKIMHNAIYETAAELHEFKIIMEYERLGTSAVKRIRRLENYLGILKEAHKQLCREHGNDRT